MTHTTKREPRSRAPSISKNGLKLWGNDVVIEHKVPSSYASAEAILPSVMYNPLPVTSVHCVKRGPSLDRKEDKDSIWRTVSAADSLSLITPAVSKYA